MTRTKILSLFLLAAVAAVTLAACGGGGGDQATAASKPANSGTSSATISVADNGNLGKMLVDSKGRSIYLFQKDTGSMSTCSGACAAEWPPVTTTGKPTVSKDLNASMVGTTTRSDGSKQVTYSGHPLYLYAGDQSSGDTKGQGLDFFGGKWYVVSTAGSAVTTAGSGSGGGYSY